jgi:2-methylaconitate cis-trans-isomerase PrpF
MNGDRQPISTSATCTPGGTSTGVFFEPGDLPPARYFSNCPKA